MKKTSLLIFLLTAVSATTVAAAAGCAKKHQHNYSWQHSAEQHWLNCDCGDKKDEGAHIDVINNSSQASESDGKCDVCGLENYTLSFDMNGYGTAPETQTVYKGGKAVKPATDPTADGYGFGGWYADADCTAPFDFNAEVTASKTVYAKWTVTVSFNANGYGTAPEAQTVKVGDKAVKPATDPVDDTAEYIFDGWCTDVECEIPFDFDNTEITAGITLYAKWVPDTRPTVTFDMNGHGDAPSKQRVEVGGKAVKPATDPVDEDADYLFGGWYADDVCETPFDFDNTEITADTVIYAKWVEDTRPSVTFDMGGHGTAIAKIRVEVGGKITKPEDPEDSNAHWIFEGWYEDDAFGTEFDFENTEIVTDTVIYAKWSYDRRVYVTFNTMGYGTAPEMQKVEYGMCATEPEAPAVNGLNFAGWYLEPSFNEFFLYTFEEELTEDIVVYAKWTVTVSFDANGHGTAPKAIELNVNKKLSSDLLPLPEATDNMSFDGWFTDADCTVAVDFDAPVTSLVTLYAKWVTGSHNLVLSGLPKNYTFGTDTEMKFSFIAPATGRFELSPYSTKTFQCYYTTSLDGDGVYYGNGYDSNDKRFDLNKNEKITITLYRGSETADTDKVSFLISEITDEDFPDVGWVTGEYSNGHTSLEFDRDNKTVVWNGNIYSLSYLGGSFDRATYTANNIVYSIKQTATDTFELSFKNSSSDRVNKITLERVIPQEPIDISKFSGVYVPVGNAKVDGITELCIYENGNGYTLGSSNTKYKLNTSGSYFDQKNNAIHFGNLLITVNLDDNGNAVSINLKNISTASNPTVVYSRTGDAPEELPEKLPLPASIELVGETLGIICNNGTVKWNDNESIEIVGYDKDNDIYSVIKTVIETIVEKVEVTNDDGKTEIREVSRKVSVKKTYKLEIEGSGDDTVVKVYDSENKLFDTLAKKQAQGLTLKLDGTDNTVTSDNVSNYYAVFEIPNSGTYAFNATSASTLTKNGAVNVLNYLYGTYIYPDYENNPGKSVYISEYNSNTKIQLDAGNKFAINLANYGSRFNNLIFTLTESTPDPGSSPDNPIILEGAGSTVLAKVDDDNYYVEFTATEAGTYNITCSYFDSGAVKNVYWINYTVDGVQNGYVAIGNYDGNYYKNGEIVGKGKYNQTYLEAPYTTVTVTKGQTVKIVLTRKNDTAANNVKVEIAKA